MTDEDKHRLMLMPEIVGVAFLGALVAWAADASLGHLAALSVIASSLYYINCRLAQ